LAFIFLLQDLRYMHLGSDTALQGPSPATNQTAAPATERRSSLAPGVIISLLLLAGLAAVALGVVHPPQTERTDLIEQPVPEQRLVQNVVPFPLPSDPTPAEHTVTETPYITETRIRAGDTLASVLKRVDVTSADLLNFLAREPKARSIYKLFAGRSVQAASDHNGNLLWVRYIYSPNNEINGQGIAKTLQISTTESGFKAEELELPLESHTEVAVGTIRSSLFAATDIAGIPDGITSQMAEVLSSKVDFLRGLRPGDQFRVVYETRSIGGRIAGAGRVLALEFVNGGKSYNAVWFSPDGETGSYYNLEGESLRTIRGVQAWSGFHPGIDYAAPMGTPIHATADGTVDFVGWRDGYGNTIVLRHHSKITTLYAHQSRFADGIKAGSKVSQGQLIGYVGSTGWSTGPHLHYEFRVADKPIDPLQATANMPVSKPLEPEHLALFAKVIAPYQQQLQVLAKYQEAIPESSNVASR
jgi:murein DD-endopeptidase MepM/ murein hydrolase activator NlpD